MKKMRKRYNIYRNIDIPTFQFEEDVKNVEPVLSVRISPDAEITLSCGSGIDFESSWQRYSAYHSYAYPTIRKHLISQLLTAYNRVSEIHEGYKNAPKHISSKTITIQSKYEEVVAVHEHEVMELIKEKENVPLKQYKPKNGPSTVLTSRQEIEADLRNEAVARLSKFGISAPSEQAIQRHISDHIEDVLALERRNAEELSDYTRKVEESIAISINARYKKEHDDKVRVINDKINVLHRKAPSIDRFYDEELKSFGQYLDTFFRDFESPYPMDVVLDYDQSKSIAIVYISFPDASKCNLPVRVAKMAGKEIRVYEYPSSYINVEYAKSICGVAYSIAVSLLDANQYLSTVVVSGADNYGKNGLFAAVFTRSDFKNLNPYDAAIEKLMLRFIVLADYQSNRFAFKPIPIDRFNHQFNSLIDEIYNGNNGVNTMSVTIEQATAIASLIHAADIERAISNAVKGNYPTVRIDEKYASVLKELGIETSTYSSHSTGEQDISDLILVGSSDSSLEKETSTSLDLFLEWKGKKKNVLEMRGVSEVEGGKIRMTQRFVTSRYSPGLLRKFNINHWAEDYVYVTKTRLSQMEAVHQPEEYSAYLMEFGCARVDKAKEYEADGKITRAIKEYERCLEYGCRLSDPFDNLIRLYAQMGDSINAARVKELKRKTWG